MKHRILILGDEIRINKPMMSYICEVYEAHFGEIGEIVFASKSNKELLFIVENLIKDHDSLCIFATDEDYPLMAKILATISSDVLELKDDNTLATKNATDFCKGSFLINLNGAKVNLITANLGKNIGEILIKNELDIGYFNIFGMDKESIKILLEPLANPYKVQICLTEILHNLILIRAEADKFGSLNGFMQSVKNLLSSKMIDDKYVIKFISDKLSQKGLKISFAESCTAGLCASYLTMFAGSSNVFDGSLVTYSNNIKHEWLGVSNDILRDYGAVSYECVEGMLNGALQSSYADFVLAISGVAGPGGGSELKPVGTIYIGALHKDGSKIVERLSLSGNRGYIREQSVLSAFSLLLKLKPDIFFQ